MSSATHLSTAQLVAQMPHAIWRANEMAYARRAALSTGFTALDAELPDAGWPRSALIELLLPQHGIGEMQLLKTALLSLSQSQRIILIQPPYQPQSMAARHWGLQANNLLWIKAGKSADAIWSTEQILKNGSCGAVLLWQNHFRHDVLRRLHLAAQSADTWLWVLRSLSCQHDSSPALLRLALQPAQGGIHVSILKRRGPQALTPLYLALADMPVSRHFRQAEMTDTIFAVKQHDIPDFSVHI